MNRKRALSGLGMALALWPVTANAQSAPSQGFESLDRLEHRVAEFAGHGGTSRAPRIDRRLRLSSCASLPELLWYGTGETTVLVRCGGPKSWQIYVPIMLSRTQQGTAKTGTVVITRLVPRGTALTAADLKIEPATTVAGGATSIADVAGKVAVRALNPGEAVRATMIATAPVVRRGDPVRIKDGSPGIEIAVDGVAEEDGAEGGRVRVRNTATGGRVQAIVAAPGIVVLPGYKNPESGRE